MLIHKKISFMHTCDIIIKITPIYTNGIIIYGMIVRWRQLHSYTYIVYNYADDNTLSYAHSNSDTHLYLATRLYFYITVVQYQPDEG